MRLKSIKLAGFKSFVDPTHVPLTSNMTAVVGPNGCGKSNIIDAVRWVMGESSAKHLRGESMADVIFNGSVSRKPVSRAAIELIFENQDGRAPGEFAQYAEISVKREVTRDGQSKYFLNGTLCRRRDVTDLFLGTGLGPRSYAIIEQGMITRLIEAKPDELRTYVEEAAGVSKYKERRRETESRISRTRDNLDRLTDVSDELGRQLERLKRQADAADRYKRLKHDERRMEAMGLCLRIDANQLRQDAIRAELVTIDRDLSATETGRLANERQRIEGQIARAAASEALDQANAQFYQHSAAIARMESQQAEYDRALAAAMQRAASLDDELDALAQVILDDQRALDTVVTRVAELEPQVASLTAVLDRQNVLLAEQSARRDALQRTRVSAQSERTRVNQDVQIAESQRATLIRQRDRDHIRQQQVETALANLSDTDPDALADAAMASRAATAHLHAAAAARTECQTALQEAEAARDQARQAEQAARAAHAEAVSELERITHELEARLAAPAAIQAWVQNHPEILGQVIDQLSVPEAHRDAFEAARGEWLTAYVVAEIDPELVAEMPAGVTLVTAARCADLYADAPYRGPLRAADQSGFAEDGLVFGAGWCRRQLPASHGVFALQAAKPQAQSELQSTEQALLEASKWRSACDTQVQQHESAYTAADRAWREAQATETQANNRYAGIEAKSAEVAQLRDRLVAERQELSSEIEATEAALQRQDTVLAALILQRDRLGADLSPVEAELTSVSRAIQTLQQQRVDSERQQTQLQLKGERAAAELEGLRRQLGRSETQRDVIRERHSDALIEQQRLQDNPPLQTDQLRHAVQASERYASALADARRELESLDHSLRELDLARHRLEQSFADLKSAQQTAQLAQQAAVIECQQWQQQLVHLVSEGEWSELRDGAEAMGSIEAIERELGQLRGRIERLGPINLVALDEYQQELERKAELDRQYAELSEALTTLEEAIRKIDRETRHLFRNTFDAINQSFGALFPTLFGGGDAWLELTDDDLLTTGVTIMARPPGKRNSTIYLLSGGEKALTALALVFAIFQLNPAPFCLLDEVDAPLDDANVGRYADAVAAMSQSVQFIYITHNKLAMERAECLMGVTMSEPGVSRLVSVDIERAVELVTTE